MRPRCLWARSCTGCSEGTLCRCCRGYRRRGGHCRKPASTDNKRRLRWRYTVPRHNRFAARYSCRLRCCRFGFPDSRHSIGQGLCTGCRRRYRLCTTVRCCRSRHSVPHRKLPQAALEQLQGSPELQGSQEFRAGCSPQQIGAVGFVSPVGGALASAVGFLTSTSAEPLGTAELEPEPDGLPTAG